MARTRQYDERVAANLCVRCGEVEPEEGCVSCRECMDEVNARRPTHYTYHRSRAAGEFNVCCQATGFHRDDCKEKPRSIDAD